MNVNRPQYVLVFAAAVSAVFTAGIMSLHAVTEARIKRNAALFEEKALVELFGLNEGRQLTEKQAAELYRKHIRRPGKEQTDKFLTDPQSGVTFELIEAVKIDPAGGRPRVVAYAFPVWGVGFWARIDGYLAVTPDLTKVVGITFLKHSETPGLGGRITELQWREKFRGLTITPPQAGSKTIYVGGQKEGRARQGRRVDAITGATGTSSAVETFLNQRLRQFRRAAVAAKLTERH